jgi:cytosine/adenosine deaminase-related metal-dependent hydrolase
LAERFGWSDERSLGKALRFITGGKETLNNEGKRVWPNVGDEASFVLTNATCAAEAVARQTEKRVVMYKGNVVIGDLNQVKSDNLV